MDIDIDSSAPTLSFRIALSIFNRSESGLYRPGRKATIQIWSVTLLMDSLRAVGLSARRLALLHHRPTILSVRSLSLLGPNIAFTGLRNERGIYTYVVKWDQVDENSTDYSWRVLNPSSSNVSTALMPIIMGFLMRFQGNDTAFAW